MDPGDRNASAPPGGDYDQLIAAGSVTVLVSPGGAEVAGLIVLVPEPGALLIENVAVDPRAQGRGLGRTMLAHAEAVARDAGLASLRLYTHRLMATNVALYTHLGYTVTTGDSHEARPIVHMTKTIQRRPGQELGRPRVV